MIRILIVDDEIDVSLLFRHKFRNELEKEEVQLYFEGSATDALRFMQSDETPSIDLVLTDINMPGMSGLDLTKRLKDQFPEIRVYIITAYAESLNYEIASSYGADEFLTKPLEFSVLKGKIINVFLRSVT